MASLKRLLFWDINSGPLPLLFSSYLTYYSYFILLYLHFFIFRSVLQYGIMFIISVCVSSYCLRTRGYYWGTSRLDHFSLCLKTYNMFCIFTFIDLIWKIMIYNHYLFNIWVGYQLLGRECRYRRLENLGIAKIGLTPPPYPNPGTLVYLTTKAHKYDSQHFDVKSA